MQKHKFLLRQTLDCEENDYQHVVAIIAGVISEELEDAREIEIGADGATIQFLSAHSSREIKDTMKSAFSYYFDTVRYVDLVSC
ncbi:MAG: hypothetical protein ABJM39_09530 [Porticoccus sp.]|jgi:hypothetical protein|uniref:hypothetical protein n=1 Tax=Porticoccus sp. TaxID=2024853 RepID=UPI003298FADF